MRTYPAIVFNHRAFGSPVHQCSLPCRVPAEFAVLHRRYETKFFAIAELKLIWYLGSARLAVMEEDFLEPFVSILESNTNSIFIREFLPVSAENSLVIHVLQVSHY